ncbi:hypothetical protein ACFY36_25310 [Actinoplanes sp. NPDC000266]
MDLQRPGAHSFQLKLEVGISQVAKGAGQLLAVETTLYAPQGNGPHAPLGLAEAFVPFNRTGEIRRASLLYLITNAQLQAMEQCRLGDLRLELDVEGFLPGASGFPGCPKFTEHIGIAESKWRQQPVEPCMETPELKLQVQPNGGRDAGSHDSRSPTRYELTSAGCARAAAPQD